MRWAERLERWEQVGGAAPAPGAALFKCMLAVGGELPTELEELLRETNGVVGQYGTEVVWPVERIATENVRFRSSAEFANLYMPFEGLVFFGDGGNGDQFFIPMRDGRTDVFVWDHESDERRWLAPSLDTFLDGWLAACR